MAAVTSTALGLATAGYQAYQGHEDKRKGQKALQDYNRQDLENSNPYEAIPISTIGSDLMREETQRTTADAVGGLRDMGVTGAAMLPGIIASNNNANREGRSYLDDQVNKRNYAIAGDETDTRRMQENREEADLAGIGTQIQTGRQDLWSGLRGVGSSAMYGANNIEWNSTPKVTPIGGKLNPVGNTPFPTNNSISAPKPKYSPNLGF